MKVGVPTETAERERRVGLVPEVVKRLTGKGHQVLIQPGAGAGAKLPDELFAEAGATMTDDVWGADIVAKVAAPTTAELGRLGDRSVLIGFLNPPGDPPTTPALPRPPGRPRSPWRPSRGSPAPRPWTRSARRPTSPATRRSCSPPTTSAASCRC